MNALDAAARSLSDAQFEMAHATTRFDLASAAFQADPTERNARRLRNATSLATACRQVLDAAERKMEAAEADAVFEADWAAAVAATTPAPSVRLVRLDETGPSPWEKMRRLLNARCGEAAKHFDADHDNLRHAAAEFASNGRTDSSMKLTDAEMGQAVSYVEEVLRVLGFDLDKADAEYAARRLAA
ncbi:hypothetical protein B1759_14915 [Rubrivirga sp. SAORIC476]|uniref:hypothetical protein n=1 Tax=Rubrivirga sp. SAORIC476 TaxID=1961794 RepID=UPI000BA98475|nr:hypothetical protein [Rubrivirga sp. SAORIC476]PAP79609.1 hypothetical protein B1759_14915 [Rubrivirga sp. SAORIC476]